MTNTTQIIDRGALVSSAALVNFQQALSILRLTTSDVASPRLHNFVFNVVGGAQRRGEVERLARAFQAGASETLDHLENSVLDAYCAIGASTQSGSWEANVRWHLTQIATLATLIASEGAESLYKIFADGWANFGPESAEALLRFWAHLANQHGEELPLPILDKAGVREWAVAVLAASRKADGGNAPHAWFRDPDEEWDLALSWQGTFTHKRWFRVRLCFGEDVKVASLRAEWDSATGKPSRFLGIETLLAHPACNDFGVTENTEST